MLLLLCSGVVPLQAAGVEVTLIGEVEFNQINDPPLGNVNPGDPVMLTLKVDSDSFVDSASFPTRGYDIALASFAFMLGTEVIGFEDPFPDGEVPYFVLRDNDPAVDGFFIATDIDFPIGVPLAQAGAFEQFRNNYSVTYAGGVLSSLDILGALGTYNFTDLTVFNWTIDDGPFNAMGIVFVEMILSSEIFIDGFESGDTSAWSATVP